MNVHQKWFSTVRPNPGASLRLFCFPYAGAGASVFRTWWRDLPNEVEICSVQLPGRETRFRERLYTSLPPLIEVLSAVALPLLDRPFAFFGHSMGGLIGFELARALRRIGAPSPQVLFLSGRRSPESRRLESDVELHQLPEPALWEQLIQMNGIDPQFLEQKELMSLLIPVIRADFSVCETFLHPNEAPLGCPIVAFGGDRDQTVLLEHLMGWRAETTGGFEIKVIPGTHFFFREAWNDFSRVLNHSLSPFLIPRTQAGCAPRIT